MKITHIYKPEYTSPMLDEILTKNIGNDVLFENTFFKIVIDYASPVDYLYRKLWETVYLRRKTNRICTTDPNSGMYVLQMSIGEAMTYIREVTPPVFRSQLEEQFVSIDVIHDMLTHYLIEESGQSEYHISVFRKVMGLQPFETQTQYDFKRTHALRQFNPTSRIIVDVEASDIPVTDIVNDSNGYDPTYDNSLCQCMLSCLSPNDITQVIRILDHFSVSILNVFSTKDKMVYVEFMCDDITHFNALIELIKLSYEKIIK